VHHTRHVEDKVMDTDESAELRQSIRHYQNRLVDCSDAEAKVLLRELIAELEKRLPPAANRHVAAKWPLQAA
jgi:hypothetical protein